MAQNIPLLALNHIEGHIFAGTIEKELELPALALIVSGGHTQLALIKSFRNYEILSNTRDDAAGEAFDKIASLLKLPYPGGPQLSKLAEEGDENAFKFPIGEEIIDSILTK